VEAEILKVAGSPQMTGSGWDDLHAGHFHWVVPPLLCRTERNHLRKARTHESNPRKIRTGELLRRLYGLQVSAWTTTSLDLGLDYHPATDSMGKASSRSPDHVGGGRLENNAGSMKPKAGGAARRSPPREWTGGEWGSEWRG
jgi:hypothetical protein